ncbi:hypothetical protein R5R35_010362 [Gryllus longicercus]|uniref:Uncharacterized protein n=1 Tax=Gryllus longicercus TaxID=2509291 RepID=A0AAN9VU24_9ORTH
MVSYWLSRQDEDEQFYHGFREASAVNEL